MSVGNIPKVIYKPFVICDYKFTIYWCSLNRETLRQDGEQGTIYFDHPTRRSAPVRDENEVVINRI